MSSEAPVVAPAKKAVVAKKKTETSAKPKPTHPKFSDMIAEGIKKLNERSGSSRQALAKFIIATYSLDEKMVNKHVKLALNAGIKANTLKQVSGNGASGSFKLGEAAKEAEKLAAKKAKAAAKPKKEVKPKVVKKPIDSKPKVAPILAAKSKTAVNKPAAKSKTAVKTPAAKSETAVKKPAVKKAEKVKAPPKKTVAEKPKPSKPKVEAKTKTAAKPKVVKSKAAPKA